MKRRHILSASLIAMALLLIAATSIVDAQKRRRTHRHTASIPAAAAASTGVPCPVKVKNIHDCPDTGCGPQADPELNKAKNRTDEPAASDVVSHTVDFMRTSLAQPKIWPAGSDRTSLRGAGQEGTPVVMKGYLWQVKKELTGESCNCKLKTLADTDLHLVIVARPNDPEATSVTVEMTPRVRAGGHPEFTFDNVKPNKGKYVRVTGWLMLDTEHIKRSLIRATNWELHPVMKFEVCTLTKAKCDAGNGWHNLP